MALTEEQWLSTERPYDLLSFHKCRNDRKRRLAACACANRVRQFMTDNRFTDAVDAAELFADQPTSIAGFRSARRAALKARRVLYGTNSAKTASSAADAAISVTENEYMLFKMAVEYAYYVFGELSRPDFSGGCDREREHQVELIRDIFGNPFRPVAIDPRWLTASVIDLSRTIYDDRAFDRMPILADALMDAGCDSQEILAHCRGPGPHVRGCWVVDLLLGKE
jgi:hypothetical protein